MTETEREYLKALVAGTISQKKKLMRETISARAKALYDVLLGDKRGTEPGTVHEIIVRHLMAAIAVPVRSRRYKKRAP